MIAVPDDLLARPRTLEDDFFEGFARSLDVQAGRHVDRHDIVESVRVASKPDVPLAEYMKRAWHVLEPGRPLVWNWHLDDMCDHLEAVSRGEIKDLVINVPPGMTKSMTVCVMWPTWEWTWAPWLRYLFFSYNAEFSTRDAVKSRRLIASPWYQERWGGVFQLTGDQNQKTRYENDRTGFRVASSFGGSTTGERGDRVVIDDPLKASEARNEDKLTDINRVYDEAISTRTNDATASAFVTVMQRLAGRDLAGHKLARRSPRLVHLVLPMEYEPPTEEAHDRTPPELSNRTSSPLGTRDPRTRVGELLDPVRFPREHVDEEKTVLGSFATASQFQQRPVPSGGGIFKQRWFKFWEPEDESYGPVRLIEPDGTVHVTTAVKLPATFTGVLQSHDLTFSGATSMAVSDVYAWRGQRVFLLDELRTNEEFTGQIAQIRELTRRWPMAALKLVEAKANGQAAISTLRGTIPGLVPVPVTEGSKPERYDSVAPYVEAGHVYIPHPDAPGRGWVYDWLTEVCAAPYGTYDDRADTMYMALARIFRQMQRTRPAVGTRVTSTMGM